MGSAGLGPGRKFDVCIVGGGVLGTCISFWISELFDCSVALVDMEDRVATHASARNTGVVHRPFYMDPEKKKRFARAANRSYGLWETLATRYSLPWRRVGILEVGTDDASLPVLQDYERWAGLNGMAEDEVQMLDSSGVRALEPLVVSKGGILSRSDAAVDYRKFTECVLSMAQGNGVTFIGGRRLAGVTLNEGSALLRLEGTNGEGPLVLDCGLLVNAAGGGALRLAHSMGVAKRFAELHFRGDYWAVEDARVSSRISHSVYSIPRRTEYPFLDPHLVLRVDGRVEVGPNAALVAGPFVYEGFAGSPSQLAVELAERPFLPKLRLFLDPHFWSLAWEESRRSVSKRAMCERVREFVPALDPGMLGSKGAGGVRNSMVGEDGFVPEAREEWSDRSLHVLNYNSPGATGAPAFSAELVSSLVEKGYLNRGRRSGGTPHGSVWKFEGAVGL